MPNPPPASSYYSCGYILLLASDEKVLVLFFCGQKMRRILLRLLVWNTDSLPNSKGPTKITNVNPFKWKKPLQRSNLYKKNYKRETFMSHINKRKPCLSLFYKKRGFTSSQCAIALVQYTDLFINIKTNFIYYSVLNSNMKINFYSSNILLSLNNQPRISSFFSLHHGPGVNFTVLISPLFFMAF